MRRQNESNSRQMSQRGVNEEAKLVSEEANESKRSQRGDKMSQ